MSFLDIDDEPAPTVPVAIAQLGEDIGALTIAWGKLTETQKKFLETWRICGFSRPDAFEMLGHDRRSYASVEFRWRANEHYAFCKKMMQKIGLNEAHDKAHQVTSIERLADKAEEGETLFYQGVEVVDRLGKTVKQANIGAALKARELALKTGGHLKEEDQASSFVLPQLIVQVTNRVGGEVEQTITVGVTPPAPELVPLWLDDGT